MPLIVLLAVLIITGCSDDPGQEPSSMPAVTPANQSVSKTTEQQANITFILSSDVDGTWREYSGASGTNAPAGVSVSYTALNGTLTLSHQTDVPAGNYFVTVQEDGKAESDRLQLTVTAFVSGGPSNPPAASLTTVAKINTPQANVPFTLSSTHGSGIWRVYDAQTGGNPLTTVSASYLALTGTLTLTSPPDVPSGNYWVSFQGTGFSESTRLGLTVNDQGTSGTPAASVTEVEKTALIQASIAFTLTTNNTGAWRVYAHATNNELAQGISAAFNTTNNALTLTHAINIPANNYWVTVTEPGTKESGRLHLTVVEQPITPAPTIASQNAVVAKTSYITASAGFVLASSPVGTWRVYTAETGYTLAVGMSGEFNSTTNILTLMHTSNISAGDYWVTVQQEGNFAESSRLQLTVEPYISLPISDPPAVSANTYTKDDVADTSAQWTLTSTHDAAAEFFVYSLALEPIAGVNIAFTHPSTITINSTNGGANGGLPARSYLVKVRDADKSESLDGLVLTVLNPTEGGQSATPVITDPVAFKSAPTDNSVVYTLSTAITGTWKVYNAQGAELNSVTASASGTTLTLAAASGSIEPGTYFISVEQSGQSESNRAEIIVRGSRPSARVHVNFVEIVNHAPVITISGDNPMISRAQSLQVTLGDISDFTRVEWRLNNNVIPSVTGASHTIEGFAVPVGYNRLTVIVFIGNVPYSVELAFMVTN